MERIMGKVKRICYIQDHVCHIPLNNGQEALCDEDRFEEVKDYSWCVNSMGYPAAHILGTSNKVILLHKLLYPELKYIDHISGSKIDNRSCNLRECSHKQNMQNQKVKTNNTSGYRGVAWNKKNNRWTAQLMFQYKNYHLGYFSDPKEAALAYNKKAVELFGEFARLNVIED